MKKILLLAAVLCSAALFAQNRKFTVSGAVADQEGKPVAFATVLVLSADSAQVAGGATDAGDGRFALAAPAGDYRLVVRYVGFAPHEEPLKVAADVALPTITLVQDARRIEDVVVKAQFITREADRFVMNVAGSVQAIGKNAGEVMALAPGVWLADDKLSINGRGGVRVMVDERMLNMDFEGMMSYLRSIKAEDIQKIEVIPSSGADYDAASQGGIIKITLRKRRQDGAEGSLSLSGSRNGNGRVSELSPAFNLNYRRNKLSLYTNLGYSEFSNGQDIEESSVYENSTDRLVSRTVLDDSDESYSVRLGGIYDLKSNQSLGLEGYFSSDSRRMNARGESDLRSGGVDFMTRNTIPGTDKSNYITASANYIWRIDSLGSVLKVIADFNATLGKDRSNVTNEYLDAGTYIPDSVYRNAMDKDYKVYSLTVAWEKTLSSVSVLKAGGKVNYNDMYDNSEYRYLDLAGGEWLPIASQSGVNKYTERISALYAIYSTRLFKKLSASAGLRAEHTYAVPESAMGQDGEGNQYTDLDDARQNYVNLFPNMNLSLPLNSKQSAQLILSYARKIERPGFWALNPFMLPLSRYSYVVGNPNLRPTITDDVSLTAVAGYRYTLTLGARISNDEIRQVGFLDPDDPDIFIYQHQNIDRGSMFYANLNTPFTIAKWWNFTVNLTAMDMGDNYGGNDERSRCLQGNFNTAVSLPGSFSVELDGWGRTGGLTVGNMTLPEPEWQVNAALKKRMLDNRFTMSLNVWNVVGTNEMRIKLAGEGFSKYTDVTRNWTRYGFSLRYNFRSGVSFKARKVESNTEEESSRMSK